MESYLLLVLAPIALSFYVSWRFKSKFKAYAQMDNSARLTGSEIALRMLRDYGIHDIEVVSVPGKLTDHYSPFDRSVNLSPDVYHGRSIAAAAVAAHECGHAVQHSVFYRWFGIRSRIVPIVSFAASYVQWILLAGVLLISVFPMLLWIGIAVFALTVAFSFITLPVEFDASRRALIWLERSGVTNSQEHQHAKGALHWAAMTYVVAALAALGTLIYYIMLANGRRD